MHLHVRRAGGFAKFWMEPLTFDSARGLKTRELMRAEKLIAEHADLVREKWHEVFGR